MTHKKQLPELSGILPARPIRIRDHGLTNRLQYLFFTIVFAFASVAVAFIWFPGLYRDYLIKSDPIAAEDASLVEGRCLSKKMTVNCKAGILYDPNGKRLIKQVEFSFLSLSRGSYTTDIVAQKTDPQNITLTLAIEKFWNRFITYTLLFALVAGLCLLFFLRFLRVTRSVSAVKTEAILDLLWAKIQTHKQGVLSTKVTYIPLLKGRQTGIVSSFPEETNPFMHYSESEDKTYGLAVLHPQSGLPILLDEGLRRLDLNDGERQRMLEEISKRIVR